MTRNLKKSVLEKLLEIGGSPEGATIKRYAKQMLGNDFDHLCESRAIVHVGNRKDITVVEGDTDVTLDVVRQDGKNMYFSPLDGWVGVLEEDIALYKIDFEWLIGQIMQALEIPPRYSVKPIMDDNVWGLGRHRIERQCIAIIIVRNAVQPDVFSALCDYLADNHKARNPALVLSLDRRLPARLQLPAQNVLVRLEEALVIESDYLEINTHMLAGKLGGQISQDGFSGGYRHLVLDGREYKFTPKQAEVIEYLHQAGGPRNQHEILAGVNSKQDRLTQVFRGGGKRHAAWGTVIMKDDRGNYWLDC